FPLPPFDCLSSYEKASKIKGRLSAELRTKDLPFTIIADESTDPHSNQEILFLCLRFVDQSSPNEPHTITKAQGLKASLLSFQTVVVFIASKNILNEVKALASKQKRDQDILEAYMMVDEVVGNIKSVRKNIDSDFQVWYKQILDLAEKLGIVEAIDHYKKSVAIPLLDSLTIQMQDQFSDEDRHTRHLLYLLITPWSYLKQQKACCSGGMTFHFPNPLGMSCKDGKLCGSQQRRIFQAIFYSHLARVIRMLYKYPSSSSHCMHPTNQ
ncbi:hypothetical protein pdam_00014705, partial [Pocillopora damicornis]